MALGWRDSWPASSKNKGQPFWDELEVMETELGEECERQQRQKKSTVPGDPDMAGKHSEWFREHCCSGMRRTPGRPGDCCCVPPTAQCGEPQAHRCVSTSRFPKHNIILISKQRRLSLQSKTHAQEQRGKCLRRPDGKPTRTDQCEWEQNCLDARASQVSPTQQTLAKGQMESKTVLHLMVWSNLVIEQ